MLTPLGKELRRVRIDNGWRLLDMANGIDVSPSFLSAVETGRKSAPADLVRKVSTWGRLDHAVTAQLERAADMSISEVRMRIPDHFGSEGREAAAVLARRFPELTEDRLRQLKELLEDGKG